MHICLSLTLPRQDDLLLGYNDDGELCYGSNVNGRKYTAGSEIDLHFSISGDGVRVNCSDNNITKSMIFYRNYDKVRCTCLADPRREDSALHCLPKSYTTADINISS